MLKTLPRLAQIGIVCFSFVGCGGEVAKNNNVSDASLKVTSVPLILRDNSALLNIRIADADVPVQLDTGNFTSVNLSKEVLERAGAQAIDGVSERMDAQGNKVVSPKFRLARMQLEDILFNDVEVRLDVHDPSYRPYQIGQQGFFGTALLKSYGRRRSESGGRAATVPTSHACIT